MTKDQLDPLRSDPDLWALWVQQSESVQRAYLDWFDQRWQRRAAHRDCLEAFLGGFDAARKLPARRRAA